MQPNQQVFINQISESDIPGYKPILMLGKGSFGSVHMCQDQLGIKWAVKVLPISDEEDFIIRKLKRCPKQVLKPHHRYCKEGSDRYFLFYPLMQMDIFRYYNNTVFTPVERRILIIQMLRALAYLHGLLIAHRDIKADNILVREFLPPSFVLSDFSIAHFYTTQNQFQGRKEFAKDILQLAVLVWQLSFRQKWKYPIHTMAVEDWANDEELKQTFNQTTCKHTNDFFLATLGARNTENIKKPHQLLSLFPPSAEFQVDSEKYIQGIVKIRSLRSQKLNFKPLPIQEEVQAENNSQSPEVPLPQANVVDQNGESCDGIVKEGYHDLLRRKYRKIKDPQVAQNFEANLDKIIKKKKIMKKARNSRRLNLKPKKLSTKCAFCLKVISASNQARHRKSCLRKEHKKRILKRQAELKNWGIKP